MIDIVERLRAASKWPYNISSPNEPLMEEAADEITRLRAALEWALERCMESDHPHYPFREDGVWKFPYQVSGAGGSGGGVGEQRFATALEAVEAASAAAKGEFEDTRAALGEKV